MESRSNKRKIPHHDSEENQEENEEEKMEKFYALINSIRDARDRFFNSSASSYDDQNKTKKRKLHAADEKVAAWKPSFRREDFVEEVAELQKPLRPVSFAATSPSKDGSSHKKDGEATGKDQLDLSLSL